MTVCFGDSITAGQYVGREKHWTSLLGITAFGVPNHTSRDGKALMKAITPPRSGTVLIQYGHNDANRWDGQRRVSLGEYAENLLSMAVFCAGHDLRPVLVVPHRTFKNGRYDRELSEYVEAADKLSIDKIRVQLPIGSLLDGIHLSTQGHWVYADQIAKVL